MLSIKDIEYIKRHTRWKLTFKDYLDKIILTLPIGMFMIACLLLFVKDSAPHTVLFDLSWSLVLCGAVALWFFTRRRLKENMDFEICGITKQNLSDIEEIARQMKTVLRIKNMEIDTVNSAITAWTKLSPLSWGEKITVILSKDDQAKPGGPFNVYLNSRPVGYNQPVTIIKDRLNVQKLKNIFE